MNAIDFTTNLLAATLAMGTSLTYATLGEVYTEKTGVLNLGMEGTMLLGALAGFATAFKTGNLLLALFMAMGDCGGVPHFARFDRGFASGFYLYGGKIVNRYVAGHFNLPLSDIGLFLHGY